MVDDSTVQHGGNAEVVDSTLDDQIPDASDGSHSHETSSLTSTVYSDLTAFGTSDDPPRRTLLKRITFPDEKSEDFSDAGFESFFCIPKSTTPSKICSLSVNLGQEYIFIARRLLMAKIRDRYGVLFPFWVCECTTVPRGLSGRRPHPSQYYPLRNQREDWREWQQMNPSEIDPGGEISLNAIEWHSENPDDKPPFHLWYLILAAIHGSPMKRLTENETKLCLIRRFSYFAFRQSSDWDCTDDWLVNLSNELEQNNLFARLDICKKDQDDTNCYWTIAQLPLHDVIFHPRNQTLDNASWQSARLIQDMQDHPVSECPYPVTSIVRAPTPTDNNSFISCPPPKIPISMLIHPVNFHPLNPEIIEITAQNIESWHWLH